MRIVNACLRQRDVVFVMFYLFRTLYFALYHSGYQREENEEDGMIMCDVSSYKAERTFHAFVIHIRKREYRLHVQNR